MAAARTRHGRSVRNAARALSLLVALVAPSPTLGALGSDSPAAVALDPLVRLATPAMGAFLSNGEAFGSAVWKATAVAQGGRRIVRMELLANGVPVATDTSDPFGGTFSTVGLPNLTTLRARATDSAGGQSASQPHTVAVARPALDPGFLATLPPVRVSTTVRLVATPLAVPGIAVTSVTWIVDGEVIGSAISAPWSIGWTAPAAPVDDLPVTVRVEDRVGSQVSIEGTIDVVDDGETLAITSPAADDVVAGAVAVAVDGNPILSAADTLALLVDGNVVATAAGDVGSIDWDSRSVDDGAHVLQVVIDRSGGSPAVSAGTSVTVTNSDEPAMTVDRTQPGPTIRGQLGLNVSFANLAGDDVAAVRVQVGSLNFATQRAPIPTSLQLTWGTNGQPDGVYRLRVIAELVSGRILQSPDVLLSVVNIRSWIRRPALNATVSGLYLFHSPVLGDVEAFSYRTSWYIDGVLVAAGSTSLYLDTTGLSNGSHTVLTRSLLTDGRRLTAGPLTFIVSN